MSFFVLEDGKAGVDGYEYKSRHELRNMSSVNQKRLC